MRIRVLSGCFAFGAAAIILGGTAAQAAVLSGAHARPGASHVSWGGQPAPGGQCQCSTPPPTPTPTPTCTTPQPSPTWIPPTQSWPHPSWARPTRSWASFRPPPVTATATVTAQPMVAASPSPSPLATAPVGGPDTGAGGSIAGGGSNVALAAGGGATALAAGVLGLLAFRRWRRTHLPAA